MGHLYCSQCEEIKDESEFTKFSKNPALKDRNQKVVICRECCSKAIENLGNTKEGLRQVLRMIDVPYLETYADRAIAKYQSKLDNTNIVIKKNVHSEEEVLAGMEQTKQQNNLYTCYVSMLGLIPANYMNYSCSDGVRNDAIENAMEQQTELDKQKNEKRKAIGLLTKTFGKGIYEDKKRLSEAVKLKHQEFSLYKNDSSKRVAKFNLKKAIVLLIDLGELEKEDYPFLFEGKDNSTKNTMVVDVDPSPITEEEIEEQEEEDVEVVKITGLQTDKGFINIEQLKDKWGRKYKADDLVEFEKKYNELKMNYKVQTASHEEFLRHACIASVKANEAMAKGDVDSAKSWMKIFQDTTSAGRLQPNQFSSKDLSGGMNTFSEWYAMVESKYDVIDILPQLYEHPRDRADIVIFFLVNYVRRLKNLPDASPQDIYSFYEEMESQFIDETNIDNFNFDDFLNGV